MNILMKRTYEDADKSDGLRILADRLWPRGIRKEDAHIDWWAKEISPSTELRKAYHGKEIDFKEFSKKYLAELKENPDFPDFLQEIKSHQTITMLTSAKEIAVSALPVLKGFIEKELG
ncbi:DUF488 family protein, N3 subclade [Chryseobacterium koreense]